MPNASEKRSAFKRLHESGCFVMPNPWDVGTTRYLQSLGFKALATTSAGYAFSQGAADGDVGCDAMLKHIAELAQCADVPMNADFEAGYAETPEGVEDRVRFAVEAGIAGLSIEDYTGDRKKGLYPIDEAVTRLKAARKAIDEAGGDTLLTGRSEGFIRGAPDLDETVKRLKAYAEAGADCLYAPGLSTREQIEAVVKAAAPKPVNVLIGAPMGFAVKDLAALGVRRISTGGAMARAAWGGFMTAAQGLAEGSFDGLAGAASSADIVKGFS